MVDHAEYIIGVFDNQKKLRSGTAQTVNYALHQGKVITLSKSSALTALPLMSSPMSAERRRTCEPLYSP